ncbi:MAG: zinc-binding dehydrogenase [Candidatus Hydrogenedentota bacterium]
MKAAVIFENGDVDCIKYEEVPEPVVGSGEVLIEVRAAALNHLDIWVRKGRPGLELPVPHILGSDAAGVVLDVGEGVDHVRAGDEVLINPGLSCGMCEFCRRGEQSECMSFGIVGMNRPGTFAERVTVPAANVFLKPSHLSLVEAAALPLAYLTAWRMLMSRATLQPGETVLIHGIGGGVALAGLQLARLAGARVLVTSSSDDKLMRAREFGAHEGVNYANNPYLGDAIRDLTGGRGVDVVLDTVGAATWPVNFKAVRRGGRIVHCGVTSGAETTVNISQLYWNHVVVMGSTMGSDEEFRQMLSAVTAARMSPVVDSVYPLNRASEATQRMEGGEQFGKIVLVPGGKPETLENMRAGSDVRSEVFADTDGGDPLATG